MKLVVFVLAAVAIPLTSFCATRIVVEAGDFDRRESVASFKLPAGHSATSLVADSGTSVPLQVEPDGTAWFIEPGLKRGERKAYKLGTASAEQGASATVTKDSVTVQIFGKTAFVYRTEKTPLPEGRTDLQPVFRRGGYIHPVLSPGGKEITDDYPRNHKHHHGIWFAWTHTQFEGRAPDFWNMGDKKGTVEFEKLERTWSGPVHAGFIAKHRQVDLLAREPKTALNETWCVRAYAIGNPAAPAKFVFDLEITDSCATPAPLKLPLYRYGGIGIRGNWDWNGKGKAEFLTSEGTTDREKGDKAETRGRWGHLGGVLQGQRTGIALFSHPENVHFPEPMRIHPTEPFLSFAPQQAGDLEITPDQPLVLRYRFIAADGTADPAELDRLWNDFGHPLKVTVVD